MLKIANEMNLPETAFLQEKDGGYDLRWFTPQAEVESEEKVRDIKPDFDLLKKVPCRGVIVTSKADAGGYDFVSRFFAPAIGVNEDPVTGSAHCCLGPYWESQLKKYEFEAFQLSKRGGVVRVKVVPGSDRVTLSGRAVTVIKGELVYGC